MEDPLMAEKRPYTAPQIVRVELNQEQAILAACSTSAISVLAGGAATQGCFKPQSGAPAGCKKYNYSALFDSAGRPS